MIGGAWLRTKHREFAIKLESIGADDFALVLHGQRQGDVRFADGRRAGEKDGVAENGAIGHGKKVEAASCRLSIKVKRPGRRFYFPNNTGRREPARA